MINQESIVIFRDFLEDNRTSMEIYSDKLESALKPFAKNIINVNSYTPSISNWSSKCKLPFGISMRYARYFSYPNQAKKNQGKIISLFSKTRVMLVCLNINRYTCFLPLVSTDDRPRQTTDSVLVQKIGTYSIYCAHSSELKYPTLFQITGWSDFTGLVLCQYLLDCHKFGTD